jgi:hypothetical protein
LSTCPAPSSDVDSYLREVTFDRERFGAAFFDTRDGLTRAERVKRGLAGARFVRARTLDAFEHVGTLVAFEGLAVSLSGNWFDADSMRPKSTS